MEKSKELFKKYRWVLLVLVLVISQYKGITQRLESVWVDVPVLSQNVKIQDCKKVILDQLSAPSTAVFTEMEYSKNVTDTVIIKWSVDSENKLGGMVRSDFICHQSQWEEMDSLVKQEWEFSDTYDKLYQSRVNMM